MPLQFTPRRSRLSVRFPNTIREYRLKAGISQRKLGEIIGHGRNAVSAWERGQRAPSLPTVLRLAKTLNTLVESLYRSFYCTPRKEKDQPSASPKRS